MIQSMTAFARAEANGDWGSAVWEVRSVNHRYLEPQFRLTESLRALEMPCRQLLAKKISRGKIDCTLRFTPGETALGDLSINETRLEQIIQQCRQLATKLEDTANLNPLHLLNWPGVVQEPAVNLDVVQSALLDSFNECLTSLITVRQCEGQAIEKLITARLDSMHTEVEAVSKRMPIIKQQQQDKLKKHFADAQVNLEPERLAQEMVMFAQKIDISEELDRLQTHITETRNTLVKGTNIGRRLDFLMQELNREANTLGAKSTNAENTSHVVELKVLIEQMREQVQNLQ